LSNFAETVSQHTQADKPGRGKLVLLNHADTTRKFLTESGAFSWFALQVRSRYESTVLTLLQKKGYESFLPTYRCRRRWSDRIKELELPLFPCYLFCRFNPQNRLPILTTPGLISIVGVAKVPTPIEEAEIAALRTLVSTDVPRQPWPYLQIGQRVKIQYGALYGLEGILVEFRGRHRMVLSVNLLQRSVAVEIDIAWVADHHPNHSTRAVTPQQLLA
jgi:transcription antitermination factor NusG